MLDDALDRPKSAHQPVTGGRRFGGLSAIRTLLKGSRLAASCGKRGILRRIKKSVYVAVLSCRSIDWHAYPVLCHTVHRHGPYPRCPVGGACTWCIRI